MGRGSLIGLAAACPTTDAVAIGEFGGVFQFLELGDWRCGQIVERRVHPFRVTNSLTTPDRDASPWPFRRDLHSSDPKQRLQRRVFVQPDGFDGLKIRMGTGV